LNSGVNERRAPELLPHALHDRTSFRGQTPDDGCPSKRARPIYGEENDYVLKTVLGLSDSRIRVAEMTFDLLANAFVPHIVINRSAAGPYRA
jgi:hypothetical protein